MNFNICKMFRILNKIWVLCSDCIKLKYIHLQRTLCDVCNAVFHSQWKPTPMACGVFKYSWLNTHLWTTEPPCEASPWLPVSYTINTSLRNGSCSQMALGTFPFSHSTLLISLSLTLSHPSHNVFKCTMEALSGTLYVNSESLVSLVMLLCMCWLKWTRFCFI